MSFGDAIIQAAKRRRDRKRRSLKNPLGDYYRSGGNELLYDLPISADGIVIDAGGYKGDWSKNVVAMYGCRSDIFEPFPEYATYLEVFFRKNPGVNVHAVGLGGSQRLTKISFQNDATSEFLSSGKTATSSTEVQIVDVADYLENLEDAHIDCLKLNIEGAEYDVLERILEKKCMHKFKSLLIQFHRQPEGYEKRLLSITERLKETHDQAWHFPMVWEKWIIKT